MSKEKSYMNIAGYFFLSVLAIVLMAYSMNDITWLEGTFYLSNAPDTSFGFKCGIYECESLNLNLEPDSLDVCDLFCQDPSSYEKLDYIQILAPVSIYLAGFSLICFSLLLMMCKCFCTDLESSLFLKSIVAFLSKFSSFLALISSLAVATLFSLLLYDEGIDYDFISNASYIWLVAILTNMLVVCSSFSLKPSNFHKTAPLNNDNNNNTRRGYHYDQDIDEQARLLPPGAHGNYIYVPTIPSAPPAYSYDPSVQQQQQQQIIELQNQLNLLRQQQQQQQQQQQPQQQQQQPQQHQQPEAPVDNSHAVN